MTTFWEGFGQSPPLYLSTDIATRREYAGRLVADGGKFAKLRVVVGPPVDIPISHVGHDCADRYRRHRHHNSGRPDDTITSGITAVVVMVAAALNPHDAWRQPILRLIDTSVGVAVGAVVARLCSVVIAR